MRREIPAFSTIAAPCFRQLIHSLFPPLSTGFAHDLHPIRIRVSKLGDGNLVKVPFKPSRFPLEASAL
jgi:hypothetical protein